jgi:hypothetical protein
MNTINAKTKGLMFGINYVASPSSQLYGCVNDVINMTKTLRDVFGFGDVAVYTDETTPLDVTKAGMMRRLTEMAALSYKESLEVIWIHYSGHGSSTIDRNRDELDGRDEVLVPSDYQSAGFITDDWMQTLMTQFNPATRVICVFDSCHSGTITDVKFSWENERKAVVENMRCRVRSKVITLSGCLDSQTAADAWDVLGDKTSVGAMTACLLLLLRGNPAMYRANVFRLLADLRVLLKNRGFTQVPKLCSTYNLAKEKTFIPLPLKRK